MKRRNRLCPSHFHSGEVYLFHRSDRSCPSQSSLYGIFDKSVCGILYLESSSEDLHHFRLWHRLPKRYRYWRRATRSEFRDYMFNLAYYEFRSKQHSLDSLWRSRDEIQL